MPTSIVTLADLPAELRSAEMVDLMLGGANAKAARVAPCLTATTPAPTDDQIAEAKLVLVGAIKRWSEAGSGALASQQAGPYSSSIDTRQRAGYNLWPSEIKALQAICKKPDDGGRLAFAVNTAPARGTAHLSWCDLMLGGTTCSCGADIAGYPIYELG